MAQCTRTMPRHANPKRLDSSMHEAVAAIAGCGVSPVVRIASNEDWMVKREHGISEGISLIVLEN